jgi:hypothetical protein
MSEEVVLSRAVLTEDGRAVFVSTPFADLPDWAKHVVRPRWDHPATCDCGECWRAMESGGP